MPRVVILGAGVSGLALGYRLQRAHPTLDVVLLERRDRPGGTIRTERRDGFTVEHGPNGFLDNKPSTVALCRDLGLAERLVAGSEAAGKNRYLFLDGRLRPLPSGPGGLIRTDLLTWRGKLSLLAERFRKARRDPGDESLAEFTRRRAGREAAEVLADAVVTGIHAGDPELLSARATFPRLVGFEEEFGSVIKGFIQSAKQRRAEARARGEPVRRGATMWTFREGLQVLIDTLTERLRQRPVTGVAARRVERTPTGWLVRGEGRDHWEADAVVLACPAYEQARVLADLDPGLAELIGGIPYNRVAVVALGYRQGDVPMSLNGFGYIAPQRTRRDVLGVQWCSSIYPERAPEGMVLLRAMSGGWNRPEVVDWDEDRLVTAVRAELHAAMGITAAPAFVRVVRWDRAIPQYHVGHLDRVARVTEKLVNYPGLFVAGNAYHGVALNDCTEQAELLAARVGGYLAGPR